MAQYNNSELLNEVARIFRARLDPGREGGTLNTEQEYSQLLEMTATTFLMNQESVFYVGSLAKNRLSSLVKQEVAIVEDMLISLDHLGQIGKPVKDTATLSNAKTALLALDSADSVSGRPELTRFSNLMDKFAAQFRTSLLSRSGDFVRPKESARNILLKNMTKLHKVHAKMLASLTSLRDLMKTYSKVDIPSRVSSTVMTSIRNSLDELILAIESDSDVDNVAKSRDTLLTALASKSAVQVVSDFSDPSGLKVRSPTNPIPSTIKHTGQVTGDGEPASVTSGKGPWPLPISDTLDIKVNGAAAVSIPVNEAVGDTLKGENSGDFVITSATENLHAVVDPNLYKGTVNVGTTTDAELNEFIALGYRHLGCPVWFSGMDGTEYAGTGQPNPDFNARVITEMRLLQTGSISISSSTISPDIYGIFAGAWVGVDEAASGFKSDHEGMYIKQGSTRYEILQVINASSAYVLVADGMSPPAVAPMELRGQTTVAGGTKFDFLPAMDAANTPTGLPPPPPDTWNDARGECSIAPAIKTVKLTTGTRTAAQVVADVVAENGNFSGASVAEEALNRFAKISVSAGDPTKLSIAVRSWTNTFLAVSGTFSQAQSPSAPIVLIENSAHSVLGFSEGLEVPGTGKSPSLTPEELVGMIKDEIPSSTPEVVEEELYAAESLNTVISTDQVNDPSVDFSSFAEEGDLVEILTGFHAGLYQIVTVAGSTLNLRETVFESSESGLKYRVIQQTVKVSSTSGPGSSIEVEASPAILGFPSGIFYGSIPQFEAVDKLGEKYPFSEVAPGDLLRIAGENQTVEVTGSEGGVLSLAIGLPSNKIGVGFEIQGGSSKSFGEMERGLTTMTESNNLLKKYGFDVDVSAVDNALTSAVLPGQNFASNRNRAKQVLADLLSLLTSNPPRAGEYTAEIPTSSFTVEGVIESYSAPKIEAVEQILSAMQERKYERASKLLREGNLEEFFATTEKTGSFGGSVMDAARVVVGDLPDPPSQASSVLGQYNQAAQSREVVDADKSFEDYDPSLESSE